MAWVRRLLFLLLLTAVVEGFLGPAFSTRARGVSATRRRGGIATMQGGEGDRAGERGRHERVAEARPGSQGWMQRFRSVQRSVMTSVAVFSMLVGAVQPSAALDLERFGKPKAFDGKTVQKQLKRVEKDEQAELRDEVKDLTNIIAKGIVRLPAAEGYPLGPTTPGALNLALENDNAALLIACYGREGGPVAAKKVPLRGLEFPFTFDLTVDNLLFPQTKSTWEKDFRAADDLGISALLDLDGKFATANENDLIGFGISKPVNIAGSQIRRDALIVVQARTGVKQYTDDELEVLSRIDFELERQAKGASLAQLAQGEGGGSIEVLTEPSPVVTTPEPEVL